MQIFTFPAGLELLRSSLGDTLYKHISSALLSEQMYISTIVSFCFLRMGNMPSEHHDVMAQTIAQ